MKKLSPKQKLFVDEYLVDLNATQAAIRAGYSLKTVRMIGCENLTKPNIQAKIQEALKAREHRTEITQDRVLKEYAKVAFLDPKQFFSADGNLIDIHKLPDDVAACIAGMDITTGGDDESPTKTYKIKIADKLKALQDVGKHLGMFEKDNNQKVSKNLVVTVDYDN
jgi:phage terminase small subunit